MPDSKTDFVLPSFAKINWFLRVLGRRSDGYHELDTLFQTVTLHDELSFSLPEAGEDEITLTIEGASELPTDENNLIVRAANALREKYAVKSGARIHLLKRIPAGGGLGGGSSNAATTLIGLTQLWHLPIEIEELAKIGAKLGADVPFFLHGGTARGAGRGTEIYPVEDLTAEFLLILTPPAHISTTEAYAGLNAPSLTNKSSPPILSSFCAGDILANSCYRDWRNDFETTVLACVPQIAEAKEFLLSAGARFALLSGSGASVFGIFDSQATRLAAARKSSAQSEWRVFFCATLSQSGYKKVLRLRAV